MISTLTIECMFIYADESLSCLLEKMPMMVYQEVAAATKNFSSECLLGEGGFGRVYKGQMKGTEEVSTLTESGLWKGNLNMIFIIWSKMVT